MAHADLNALKTALLPTAKQMLTEYGEFFPYGAFMKLDGEIVHCSATEGTEHPPSQNLIDILTEGFRLRASQKEIRAAGICIDVHVGTQEKPEKVDAVQFALEHQNSEAVNAFLIYDLDIAGEVRFSEIFASRRDPTFFINRA